MKKQFDIYKPDWMKFKILRLQLTLRGLYFSGMSILLDKIKPQPMIIDLTNNK